MTKLETQVVIIDHLNTTPQEVVSFVSDRLESPRPLTIIYTGYFSKRLTEALPSDVSVEYLSRGLLPTSIGRFVVPFSSRIGNKIWRLSRPLRLMFWRFKQLVRLLIWKMRSVWRNRERYVRSFLARLVKGFDILKAVLFRMLKRPLKIAFRVLAPIFWLLVALFIEWPSALVLALFRKKEPISDSNGHASILERVVDSYHRFTFRFFEQRILKFKKQNDNVEFEFMSKIEANNKV